MRKKTTRKNWIRKTIIRALKACNAKFTEKIVTMLEKKVRKEKRRSTNEYAFVCAHNWAISEWRMAEYKKKRLARERLKKEKEKEEESRKKQAQKEFEQAKDEFWTAAEKGIADVQKCYQANTRKRMKMLYAAIFENAGPDKLACFDSQSNQSSRNQDIRRARTTIRQYASSILWKVISKHRKNYKKSDKS